eukprot:TRINITY_DN18666_c0_g1_i1.p1 TRINITY_DN18666_c0_g1~~TRINITY_DN18666_c0_g1_i1.p1  ORF type:complete len:396 (-),score=54.95 TRINITY_DN18666_c0_g1_i1:141-1328(-)
MDGSQATPRAESSNELERISSQMDEMSLVLAGVAQTLKGMQAMMTDMQDRVVALRRDEISTCLQKQQQSSHRRPSFATSAEADDVQICATSTTGWEVLNEGQSSQNQSVDKLLDTATVLQSGSPIQLTYQDDDKGMTVEGYMTTDDDGWMKITTDARHATLFHEMKDASGNLYYMVSEGAWHGYHLSAHWEKGVGLYRNYEDAANFKVEAQKMLADWFVSKNHPIAYRNSNGYLYCCRNYSHCTVNTSFQSGFIFKFTFVDDTNSQQSRYMKLDDDGWMTVAADPATATPFHESKKGELLYYIVSSGQWHGYYLSTDWYGMGVYSKYKNACFFRFIGTTRTTAKRMVAQSFESRYHPVALCESNNYFYCNAAYDIGKVERIPLQHLTHLKHEMGT